MSDPVSEINPKNFFNLIEISFIRWCTLSKVKVFESCCWYRIFRGESFNEVSIGVEIQSEIRNMSHSQGLKHIKQTANHS